MKNELRKSRFLVLTGNYGSGKTELALHLALQAASAPGEDAERVTLVDLDIVNPYFRSAEKKDMLQQAGVRLLMPTFALTTVDIPALPPEIQSVFESRARQVIFDVGGDDTGAAALGRYYPSFQRFRGDTCSALVINCMRPLTQCEEDILELAERISHRGRLGVDLLINNTNLADATEPEMVEEGERIVLSCARRMGISQVLTSGEGAVLSRCALRTETLVIERKMVPEWMTEC